jgi:hypothetical protein
MVRFAGLLLRPTFTTLKPDCRTCNMVDSMLLATGGGLLRSLATFAFKNWWAFGLVMVACRHLLKPCCCAIVVSRTAAIPTVRLKAAFFLKVRSSSTSSTLF